VVTAVPQEGGDRHERDHQEDDGNGRAEADPVGFADAVVRDKGREQLEPVPAAVDDVGDVEGPKGLDGRDHHDHDVDRPHGREDDVDERLALAGAVDRGRLAEGGIEGLQACEVEDHDVADVAPAGRHDGRPDVQARVPEPVGRTLVS
jgi:hypothetical protein